jgi:hypothetical protein
MRRLHTISALFLVACLLNGALFNRIGNRIAESSCFNVLLNYACDFTGNETATKGSIRISGRYTPVSVPVVNGGILQASIFETSESNSILLAQTCIACVFIPFVAGHLSPAHTWCALKPPVTA